MVADQPGNLIIKRNVACPALVSEGQGTSAAFLFSRKKEGTISQTEKENSKNKVREVGFAHPSIASRAVPFPDTALSAVIIIGIRVTKVGAYLDRTLLLSPHSVIPVPLRSRRRELSASKAAGTKKKITRRRVENSFGVGESSITLSQRFCFAVHIVSVSPGIKSLGGSCADNREKPPPA